MAIIKQTLYELLEVAPNASLDEIKIAHKLMARKLVSGEAGLSREDIDFKLKVIDMALQTLSVQSSRDAYDAQLAPLNEPVNLPLPVSSNAVSIRNVATSLMIAAAIEENHGFPLQVVSTTVAGTVSSLKKILRIIIGLLVAAVVIKMTTSVMANNQRARAPNEVSKAEEKVILQEYYLTHGVRPASKEEADLLEIENRRKDNAQRAAALEQKRKDDEYQQFISESKKIGDKVSASLSHDEQRARWEAQREEQKLEEEKLKREAAERDRIEENRRQTEQARRKLGLE